MMIRLAEELDRLSALLLAAAKATRSGANAMGPEAPRLAFLGGAFDLSEPDWDWRALRSDTEGDAARAALMQRAAVQSGAGSRTARRTVPRTEGGPRRPRFAHLWRTPPQDGGRHARPA